MIITMEDQRLTATGDLIWSADAYSIVQPEEKEAQEQGERPLIKAKDALGALDTLLSWESQQEHPNLESVKILLLLILWRLPYLACRASTELVL